MAIMDEINRITGVKTGGSIEDALKNMQQGGGSGAGSGAGGAAIEEMSLDPAGLAEDPPVYKYVSERTTEQIATDFKAGKRVLFHIPPSVDGSGHTICAEDIYIPVLAYQENSSGQDCFAVPYITNSTAAFTDGEGVFEYLTNWDSTNGKVSCDYFIE